MGIASLFSKIFGEPSQIPSQNSNSEGNVCLVVGLGNPGEEYDRTRHNIGFYLLDGLASEQGVTWTLQKQWQAYEACLLFGNKKIRLLKPQTFMNLSGIAVQKACHYLKLKPNQVLVVCDDISIPFGQFKVSSIPGSAGHKGIQSIIQHLGNGFVRYRIGIGGCKAPTMTLKDFVLEKFTEEEESNLPFVLQNFKKNLEVLIDKGVMKGMNFLERSIKIRKEK